MAGHFIVNHCDSAIDREQEGTLRWKEGLKRLGSAPSNQDQEFSADRLLSIPDT